MLNFPLFPVGASTLAGRVDTLMWIVTGIAVFFATLIACLIVFFSLKYHFRRTAVDRSNPPTFSLSLEIAWIAVPLAIVLSLFVTGARLFVTMRQPPRDAIEMYVVGKQWMWKMQHPEGRQEINELHVPVGYPVRLVMTSQDVIHSLFIPAFRVKQDILPGRYIDMWFQATLPGEYHLFCSQYCGTLHSGMVGKVVAMPPAEYARWLSGPAAAPAPVSAAPAAGAPQAKSAGGALNPTMVAKGAALFKDFKCGDCHKPDGTGQGPSLNGIFGKPVALESGKTVTADETYIRESILQPNAKIVKGYKPLMPAFQGQVEEDELLQLITYIKSLKGHS